MKSLGKVTIYNRPLYSASVPDFAALADFELPSDHAVILLISDACGVNAEFIHNAAAKLIKRGVVYACAWGPDCERVHDIFDEADIGDGSGASDEFIMTTWHSDDSLYKAVEFFVTCAFPLDQHLGACSWIVITIADIAPASSVESAVARAISANEITETQNMTADSTASRRESP